MKTILILAGIVAAVAITSWLNGIIAKANKYGALKPKLDNLEKNERELASKAAQKDQQFAARSQQLDERERAVVLMAEQKATGFPWLADAYAEFFYLEDMKLAQALETKSHPAPSAAAQVREAAQRRRAAESTARILKYQLEFYEGLFPWLVELRTEDIDEELLRIRSRDTTLSSDDDPATKWLTPEEYNRLPTREKYQTALDRYWTRKRTKWEIGRDYERYIGWRFESKGSAVRYQGIIEGFDDLGRDLIVSNGNKVRIVQCKCWSKEKTIHEKHVFQLYGTLVAFKMDHPGSNVEVHFVTSTSLSDRAKRFADFLGIKVTESLALRRYPCIKCNVARRDGERIYHLPFDQQYDTTIVEADRGECYVETVADAESRGFRRAWRYRGGHRNG